MTTEYSGSGDPKRVMELLWGTEARPTRGPKRRLTVAEITRAAIDLADAAGLEALSMRRLAAKLRVPAMSLYTYVPGKAELIDIMVDAALGEALAPEEDLAGGDWRTRLEAAARRNHALYLGHPWMLQVATARPPMGPNLIAKYDQELRAVAGAGLSDVEMDLVITLLADYVHGAARAAVASALVRQRTGMSDEEWWSSYAPLLEQVFDASRYPTAARVGTAAGQEYNAATDPERAFEFGLQRVLDGVGALIDERGRPGLP